MNAKKKTLLAQVCSLHADAFRHTYLLFEISRVFEFLVLSSDLVLIILSMEHKKGQNLQQKLK